MKLRFFQIQYILFLILLSVGFFLAGYLVSDRNIIQFSQENGLTKVKISRELPRGKEALDFNLFWQVWDKLHKDYYAKEKLDPEKLVYGAIKGMVEAAGDPYTAFLPPSDQKRTQDDLLGSFEGVGIQIGFKGTQMAVIAPLKDSPAEQAGVQGGDYILAIKDEQKGFDKGTIGMNLPEAVDAIRGPSGSPVTLTLLRAGVDKPIEVSLTRKRIDVPSVLLSYVEDKDLPGAGLSADRRIAHLKLLTFGGETQKEWERLVNEINRQNVQAVVFDLRNNTGGYLSGAVYIASEFLKSGTVVIQENASGERTRLEVDRRGKLIDIPIIVLINKGSASASEIVAGALRDNKRAKLVGQTSFGKGTIQGAEELSGGAGLHITTARWLTPNGTWVHDKGLEPDFTVEDKTDTHQDEQLQKAVEMVIK